MLPRTATKISLPGAIDVRKVDGGLRCVVSETGLLDGAHYAHDSESLGIGTRFAALKQAMAQSAAIWRSSNGQNPGPPHRRASLTRGKRNVLQRSLFFGMRSHSNSVRQTVSVNK